MTRPSALKPLVVLLLFVLAAVACQPAAFQPTSTAVPTPAELSATPVASTTTARPTVSPVPPTETALPPIPTDTDIPPTPVPSAEVIVKQMNLRAGPGTNYTIVALLAQGDVLTVVGRSSDSTWLSVRTAKNVAGWCSASDRYVRLSVDISTLAAVAAPLPSAKVAGSPAETQVAAVAPTSASVHAASATPASAPTAASTQPAPSEVPPTTTPSPVPAVQAVTLYFYFGAEGCPYSRTMAPRIEQFYQQYAAHASLLSGVTLAAFRPGQTGALAIPLAERTGPRLPAFLPPLQGSFGWTVIGVPASWWGGDPANFRSATGVTFPFGSDPGFSIDRSRIPITVVANQQTGVYRVATIGVVSYSTLVYQANAAAGGADSGPASGTA